MNNKKKIYATSLLCIISIPLMVGCSNIDDNIKLNNEASISTTELLTVIDEANFNKYKNSVVDYNFGSANLGESDEKVKVDIKGILGVPDSVENAPIIFILSGNNNSSVENDNAETNTYKGFKYLVDALSKSGFITVAINSDILIDESKSDFIVEDKILDLVFKEHYSYLKDAINGKSNKYSLSLYKKGDLSNIGLIGQSNTGRTIYNIANQNFVDGNDNIKGLLSITPSSGITISSYPDIPSSILSTEHSLDTNIGFDMYNDIEKTTDRKALSQLTYLIGGNSDKFNERVKEDTLNSNLEPITKDTKLARTSMLTNEDTIQDESSHEDFLAYYAVDFFEYIFNIDTDNNLYNPKLSTAQKIYQKDILSKLYTSEQKFIFDNLKDTNILFNGIKSKNVVESSISTIDTAIDFNEPSTNIELNLLQLDWKSKNSFFTVALDDSKKDFSDYNSVSIEWALNHASDLNLEDLNKVSVTVEDFEGNKSKIILLDEVPLNKIIGESEVKVVDNKSFSTWSRFTPIAETRVSLDLFEGIDLKNIKDIVINFEDNESGSIYLKNISLKR